MNLIECKNVTLGYDNKKILTNLNLKIEKGMYLCIVGNNGSGKSTLIKTILGLNKPLKGKIKFNGLKSKEIGYLPQINENLKNFPAIASEIIISGCLNKHSFISFYTKKDKEKLEENVKRLKIKKLINKSFANLSGGEKQKILLARALMATDKIILLDEPTTGLDPVAQKELYNLINKLKEELEITIIMVSHDVHTSLKYATHILHLDGENTFFGTTLDYQKSGKCEHFIGGC